MGNKEDEVKIRLPAYIKVIIDYAEWISPEYREIAGKDNDANYLMELLLCAADNVPVDVVKEAVKKEGKKDAALKSIRYKYIYDMLNGNYEKQFEKINNKLISLEKTAGKLLKKFEKTEEIEQVGVQTISEREITDNQKENKETKSSEKTDRPYVIVVKEEKSRKKLWGRKGGSKNSYENLIYELLSEENYSEEQLKYLLDAIEEGETVENIRTFASSKFPVDVMKRLRQMQEKKGEDKNGTG